MDLNNLEEVKNKIQPHPSDHLYARLKQIAELDDSIRKLQQTLTTQQHAATEQSERLAGQFATVSNIQMTLKRQSRQLVVFLFFVLSLLVLAIAVHRQPATESPFQDQQAIKQFQEMLVIQRNEIAHLEALILSQQGLIGELQVTIARHQNATAELQFTVWNHEKQLNFVAPFSRIRVWKTTHMPNGPWGVGQWYLGNVVELDGNGRALVEWDELDKKIGKDKKSSWITLAHTTYQWMN